MKQCPPCHRTDKQVKNGKTVAGRQVYKCQVCQRKYMPEPKTLGHVLETRQQAMRLVLDGNSQRQAARHVGVAPQSVANWLRQYADSLPETLPGSGKPVEVAEQDELFTFIGDKKNEVYIMTIVDRQTRCFLAIQAVAQPSQETAQQMVEAVPAAQYDSDQFPLYDSLTYRRGYHLSLPDKSETYSLEGGNADLRHYLTRLVRKSRCFSRCLTWLNRQVKAFAHAWNRRQLHNRARPFDKKPVIDFICLQV